MMYTVARMACGLLFIGLVFGLLMLHCDSIWFFIDG